MAAITRRSPKRQPSSFDQLDGWHLWQDKVPGAFVSYQVRKLHNAQVLYFNFELAKEMGLINKDAPHTLTKNLKKEILDTFAIRIINEYDKKQNVRFHPTMLKSNSYMATRYLQLQHTDKSGRTSGDGRSIWNGQVEHNGVVWDVSSRGTGVTCLSPGAVEAQKPLRSGSTTYGYGCGMADIDELIGAAIMAEIFHNNGVNTERVLCVLDLGDGNGIGVRAGKNLFRPAHLFLHLKQGQYDSLKKATDFVIDRQFKNGEWPFQSSNPNCYAKLLDQIVKSFARFSAQLDRDYIFAWLDWDGDNVLTNAGIIDYGSIRQFGLRHDEYRYDDVDRFSTTLKEQKAKTRLIVQTFAQMTDFLTTGKRKTLDSFKDHWSTHKFDELFATDSLDFFLAQIGLPPEARLNLIRNHRQMTENFYKTFSSLESLKTNRKMRKVPDGVNRPAILNMRSLLVDLPKYLLATVDQQNSFEVLPNEIFFDLALADSARGRDRRLTPSVSQKIELFQKHYSLIIKLATPNGDFKGLLKNIVALSTRLNRTNRLTGDGLLYIVDEVLQKKKKRHLSNDAFQSLISEFIREQSPGLRYNRQHEKPVPRLSDQTANKVFKAMLSLVDDNKESI